LVRAAAEVKKMMLSSWIDRHMHVASDGFVPAAYRRWFEYGLRLTLPLYSVRGSCVSDAELGKFITYFPQPYVPAIRLDRCNLAKIQFMDLEIFAENCGVNRPGRLNI